MATCVIIKITKKGVVLSPKAAQGLKAPKKYFALTDEEFSCEVGDTISGVTLSDEQITSAEGELMNLWWAW